jgi:hypothetical protein
VVQICVHTYATQFTTYTQNVLLIVLVSRRLDPILHSTAMLMPRDPRHILTRHPANPILYPRDFPGVDTMFSPTDGHR